MQPMRITVLGATGFVGRRLVARLLATGHRVLAAARHADPGLWQAAGPASALECAAADLLDAPSLARVVVDADRVVNLVGAVSLPNRDAYFELHERGARDLAAAAAAAQVGRLVHVSALGIAREAPSAADRSKAAGEAAVRAEFPAAVLVRPSLVYGDDDHFLSRVERMSRLGPVVPLLGADTRVQPLHVDDFADGLVRILERPDVEGRMFEFAGPRVLTLRQVVRLLLRARRRRRLILPLGYPLARMLAQVFDRIPGFPLGRELVELMRTDKTATGAGNGLAALGIHPRDLEDWLARQSRAGGPGRLRSS